MLKRILMNQVDASPGNSAGAAPAAVPDEVQPQAQGAAPISITQADLDAAIASAVDRGIAKARDSLYAEARRSASGQKPAKASDSPPSAAAQATLDPLKLRSLDRALAKTGLASRLTDSQYQRAEKAFAAEDPSDAEAWTSDYFAGFSGSPSTTTQPSAAPAAAIPAQPAQPTNAQPASSRGAPPAPQVPLDEMNVWTMSVADRDAFIAKHGTKKYLEKARQQGRNISIDPRR